MLARSAGGPKPIKGRLFASSLRPRAFGALRAGSTACGIGLGDNLLGATLAGEQDAQRVQGNAGIKPE